MWWSWNLDYCRLVYDYGSYTRDQFGELSTSHDLILTPSRSYNWVYLLALAGYAWIAWNLFNLQESESTVCVFKNVTGFACPSCGSSRSLLALLHGDLTQALLINPLGFLGALFLLVLPIVWLTGKMMKQDIVTQWLFRGENFIKQPKAAIPLVALLVVNWIWNVSKGL